jgi:hypothetical protein
MSSGASTCVFRRYKYLWFIEYLSKTYSIKIMKYLGTKLDIAGSTSASATLTLEAGTAPASPNNGDIWQTGSTVFMQLNGIIYALNSNPWVTISINFGSKPVTSQTFTITDANCTTSSIIQVVLDSTPVAGRVGNDWSWDAVQFSTVSGTGSFTLSAIVLNGSMVDSRNIQYKIN